MPITVTAFTMKPSHTDIQKDNRRAEAGRGSWENTKRESKIAKWSRWEEREEIRLIEQKVVKCM